MIREDRELLAELARLNGDMASLGMRIMDGSASADEQMHYAQRLIAAEGDFSGGWMECKWSLKEMFLLADRLRYRRMPSSRTGNSDWCAEEV